LLTALDLAEEPISIYRVVEPMNIELEHVNDSAVSEDARLLEKMLADPLQKNRIRAAWPALEEGRSVVRLIRSGKGRSKRWISLELRPMLVEGKLNSLVTIECTVRVPEYGGRTDDVSTMQALSREILDLEDLTERRDAFSEVLREEMGATASFSRTARTGDVVLRVKENNGYVVMPAGVLFDSAVAVDLSWSGILPSRRLTAFRIFLEGLNGG
jgi:hypothetical protein